MPKKYLYTLIAIWVVWLASTYVIAFQKATCGNFWESACLKVGWDNYSYMVTFGWLKDYQEAFAGIATLGAAIIASIAIRWQVRQEARHRWMERRRQLLGSLLIVAVEFDIANGNYKNSVTTWLGSDFGVIDQLAIDLAAYDANMLELAKRARILIDRAVDSSQLSAAADLALAAHEAFRQAAEESVRPSTRSSHFNPSKLGAHVRSNPENIRDLRHYFKWS